MEDLSAPVSSKAITLAIVGSRRYVKYRAFKVKVEEIIRYNGWTIRAVVSGSAIGVDSMAKRWAKEKGLPLIEHPPDYDKYDPQLAPLERNTLIVRDADVVIAFPDALSRGTLDTMSKAEKMKKELIVVHV